MGELRKGLLIGLAFATVFLLGMPLSAVASPDPPTAPVVDVTPDFPIITDDLVCTIITPSTDPDFDPITYTYEWYKDDVLQGGLTNVTTDLSVTIDSSNTARGEVWRCVVTPNDGTVDGPSAYDEVTVQNSPPTAPVVDVAPDFPLITDDLLCSITSPSTDADGDTVTYTYQWYKDGVPQGGLTTDTVPAANTAVGEVWKCEVTPYDGFVDGSSGYDEVTIQNRPPTAPVVDVTPDLPTATDDLVCTITSASTDPDGHTVTYTYEWYKDGVPQGGLTTDTVPAANTTRGQVWKCVVTPYDGEDYGSPGEDQVTVRNSPPNAPVVDVTPDLPTATDDLVCTITSASTDPDGDTVTYTYEWYKYVGTEWVLQPGLTTPTVPAANTARGEVWRCAVIPNDGFVNGSSANTNEVTVQNSTPTAPVVDVAPDFPDITDDLVCTIITPSTDAEDDPITYTYKWYKDGELQPGLTTVTTDLSVTIDWSNTARGEVWKCVVTPNDGFEDGAYAYDEVNIANNPPTAPGVDVAPDFPIATDDLVCTIITPSTDPDPGDTVTYTYQWYKDGVLQPDLTTANTDLTTVTIPAVNTAVGEVWRCVVTPNDGFVDGSSAYDEVTIQSTNLPPSAPDVAIVPDSPTTIDDLVCIAESIDPDGDPVTYTYEWYKDDELQPELTSNTVPLTNTARGEVWRCEVTPHDGIVEGVSVSDNVTIRNSPPTSPVVDVTPDLPVTTDDLVCTIITPSADADGDTITYTYRWFKDDATWEDLTTNTVPAASTAKGQVWRCVVTPNDGFPYGIGASAYDEITIQNSLPTAPAVDVTPELPVATDDLVCTVTTPSTDADGDTITYTYEWYKDGELQPDLTTDDTDLTTVTISAANTARGEVWRCVVTPNDGEDGTSAYDEVTIAMLPYFALVISVTNEIPPDIYATEADTEVSFSGLTNVTGTIGVGKYDEEPTFPTITLSDATGKVPLKFVDIQVIGFAEGTAHVKVHYTDDEVEVAGLVEESLRLYYWDGTGNSWVLADNCSVDTGSNIVSGAIPVSALAGTPVAVGGDLPEAEEEAAFRWALIAIVIGALVGGLVVISALVYLLRSRR